METEKGATQTVSEVTIAGVTHDDMGKYSCRPTEGRTDTVMLIVERGAKTFMDSFYRTNKLIYSTIMINVRVH